MTDLETECDDTRRRVVSANERNPKTGSAKCAALLPLNRAEV
jgi:hypothetical protein